MKKFLFVLASLLLSLSTLSAQNESSSNSDVKETYVKKSAIIEKYHNEVELEQLGKLELTELYLERVAVLSEIVPYIALSKNPAGATLEQLGIPETKTNISHLEDEVSNREEYIVSVKETLHDIIPYADKKNIIWGIMFLEDTIHKVEKAAKSNLD